MPATRGCTSMQRAAGTLISCACFGDRRLGPPSGARWSVRRIGRRDGHPWFRCVGSRATARTSNVAAAARTTGGGSSLDRLEGSTWNVPTLATALALQAALDPSEPSGPAPDAPELHPALLSAMLRRDGILTNDEIDELVSTYSQLVAASCQRAARMPRVRVPAAGPRLVQDVNAASARSSRSC